MFERKTTDKREQYDWMAEKNWTGSSRISFFYIGPSFQFSLFGAYRNTPTTLTCTRNPGQRKKFQTFQRNFEKGFLLRFIILCPVNFFEKHMMSFFGRDRRVLSSEKMLCLLTSRKEGRNGKEEESLEILFHTMLF